MNKRGNNVETILCKTNVNVVCEKQFVKQAVKHQCETQIVKHHFVNKWEHNCEFGLAKSSPFFHQVGKLLALSSKVHAQETGTSSGSGEALLRLGAKAVLLRSPAGLVCARSP